MPDEEERKDGFCPVVHRLKERNMKRMMVVALLSVFAVGAALAQAPAPLIDSGVISGLGARNIGSAAMSGRIAASHS